MLGSYPHILRCHFESDKKLQRKMWHYPPYGIGMPYVQNTMQRDAFKFLQQYIHFANNYQQPKQSDNNYDPLFKVTQVLKEIRSGICRVWQAGKDVSLNESMIKYLVVLLRSSNICQQSQSNME
jgi:hypothetical protein